MIGVPPPDLDQDRLTHLLALTLEGPTHQRDLHYALATRMAAAAGLTLAEAIQSIVRYGKKPLSEIIERYRGGDGVMSLAADQERADRHRRAELLTLYGGDEEGVFQPSPLERRLMAAVDGYPAAGSLPDHFRYEDLPDEMKDLFRNVFPVHATPASAMAELRDWDRVHRDRQLFACYDTEWWIDGRKRVLEHIVDTYPARSNYDIQARIRLWQMRSKAGAFLNPDEEGRLQERLLDDLRLVEIRAAKKASRDLRSTKERTAEVRRLLKNESALSNREIARRVGVSPQTVANQRRKSQFP